MNIAMIKAPTEEDWLFCKQCTLVTIGKNVKNPPTQEWKHKILKARHSPIRELRFAFLLQDIPYWVSVHLGRHIHAQPYVRSQRNDRQEEYDRNKAPQDAPINMIWTMNAEELMTIANKRLCRQASAETRYVVQQICDQVTAAYPEFKGLLISMCEQEGRCREMFPCGRCKE